MEPVPQPRAIQRVTHSAWYLLLAERRCRLQPKAERGILVSMAKGYRFAGPTGWGRGRVWHTNRGHQYGRCGRLEVAGDEIVNEGQPRRTQAQGECGEGKTARDDAGFELGRSITARAEDVKDRVERRVVKHGVSRVATEGLVEA